MNFRDSRYCDIRFVSILHSWKYKLYYLVPYTRIPKMANIYFMNSAGMVLPFIEQRIELAEHFGVLSLPRGGLAIIPTRTNL